MYKLHKNRESSNLSKNQRDEIIKKLQRLKTPDDVIASIFAYLNVKEIPASFRVSHTAVSMLKESYPSLLKEFVFSTKGIYPFSELLERVFFQITKCGAH